MNDKIYNIPDPILDAKELARMKEIEARYEEITSPGFIQNVLSALNNLLPDQVSQTIGDGIQNLSEAEQLKLAQELYNRAMEIIGKGAQEVMQAATKITIDTRAIVNRANDAVEENEIEEIEEICLARSYALNKARNDDRNANKLVAAFEGGATGAPGFIGIPFNLVLSTLLYFRAVQNVAFIYGYNVWEDPAEMEIAGQVLANGFSPRSVPAEGLGGIIGKIMLLSEAQGVKVAAKAGWRAMVDKGGAALLLAKMRALANAFARKALEQAGKKGLENTVLKNVFEQIGKRLTLKVVERSIPIISAAIGALFDLGQMSVILEYAELFYEKRFLLEKEIRIHKLLGLMDDDGLDEVIIEFNPDGE